MDRIQISLVPETVRGHYLADAVLIDHELRVVHDLLDGFEAAPFDQLIHKLIDVPASYVLPTPVVKSRVLVCLPKRWTELARPLEVSRSRRGGSRFLGHDEQLRVREGRQVPKARKQGRTVRYLLGIRQHAFLLVLILDVRRHTHTMVLLRCICEDHVRHSERLAAWVEWDSLAGGGVVPSKRNAVAPVLVNWQADGDAELHRKVRASLPAEKVVVHEVFRWLVERRARRRSGPVVHDLGADYLAAFQRGIRDGVEELPRVIAQLEHQRRLVIRTTLRSNICSCRRSGTSGGVRCCERHSRAGAESCGQEECERAAGPTGGYVRPPCVLLLSVLCVPCPRAVRSTTTKTPRGVLGSLAVFPTFSRHWGHR